MPYIYLYRLYHTARLSGFSLSREKKENKNTTEKGKKRKKQERKRKNIKRKKEPEQPPLAYGQPAWPSAAAAPDEFPPMSCPALSCYTPVRMYEGHIREI